MVGPSLMTLSSPYGGQRKNENGCNLESSKMGLVVARAKVQKQARLQFAINNTSLVSAMLAMSSTIAAGNCGNGSMAKTFRVFDKKEQQWL